MSLPLLTGKRVELQISAAEDPNEVENLLAFYQKNEDHLSQWDPQKSKDFFTLEFWQRWLEMALREFRQEVGLRFLIKKNDSKKLIGFASFTNIERGPFQNCRLGYKIDKDFQSQGLMTEALELGIDYIFRELALHRIEANYIPNNLASEKVLQKLGFEKHGLAPAYLHINGKWQDHILTSLRRENWPKK